MSSPVPEHLVLDVEQPCLPHVIHVSRQLSERSLEEDRNDGLVRAPSSILRGNSLVNLVPRRSPIAQQRPLGEVLQALVDNEQFMRDLTSKKSSNERVRPSGEENKPIKPTWTLVSHEEMIGWLDLEYQDFRITLLQQLMRYICGLAASGAPAIHHAMRRVVSNITLYMEDDDSVPSYLQYGFCACFKSLIYLEAHNISFDAELVVEMVNYQAAYHVVACLLYCFQHRYCGVYNHAYMMILKSPQLVVDPVTFSLVYDLKAMARGKGPWKPLQSGKSDRMYGEWLQDTPIISLAKKVATNGETEWENLEFRRPKGPYSQQNETAILIMAYVSAVDRVFGVSRKREEWESLRESLLMHGVCDDDGDLYTDRSITNSRKAYGRYYPDQFDVLTPIGFQETNLQCQDAVIERKESTEFTSLSHIDGSTIRIERKESEELVAFFLDVSFAKLTENVELVSTSSILFDVEFLERSVVEHRENEWLGDSTKEITRNWFGSLTLNDSEEYPSPKGIEAIAFALQRPWGEWRGVNIANGAASVVALQELRTALEALQTARAKKQKTIWDGFTMDLETIALSRTIELKPSSYVLTAYLAHISTYDKFNWNHISSIGPLTLGDENQVALPNQDAVSKFVDEEKRICESLLPDDRCGIIGSSHGFILVRTGRPIDMVCLAILLLAICLAPAIARFQDDWRDALSEGIQNLGTGMAPILVLYSLALYRGWDIRDMLQGRKSCITLDIASKMTGRTKENILLCAKEKGIAGAVFQTVGNSVALHGGEGFGNTWSGEAALATELMDLGSIFLTRDAGKDGSTRLPEGMIDVGGYLHLKRNSDFWRAEQGIMEPGLWHIMNRDEVDDVKIN